MTKVLVINGSYRAGGVTDQVLALMSESLRDSGAEVETILLREQTVEFCTNCRACTQQPGVVPGACVINDGMQQLIDRIERSDAYILAAPTNCGTVTALFKRFMERLVAYTFWPWGQPAPQLRKKNLPQKPALLVSSCAAPGFIGRLLGSTRRQLQLTARTIGAASCGTLFLGLMAKEPRPRLSAAAGQRARTLARRLL